MSGIISHSGIVDSVSNGVVTVRIVQSSACSACKVATYCSSVESKEKLIEVRCSNASHYKVGQEVDVTAAAVMGFKAVLFAFVIPSVLLLVVIGIGLYVGASEPLAALGGIVTVILYYMVIYKLNDKLKKELAFTLSEPKQSV